MVRPGPEQNGPIADIRLRFVDSERVETARQCFGLSLLTDGQLVTSDPWQFAEAIHGLLPRS